MTHHRGKTNGRLMATGLLLVLAACASGIDPVKNKDTGAAGAPASPDTGAAGAFEGSESGAGGASGGADSITIAALGGRSQTVTGSLGGGAPTAAYNDDITLSVEEPANEAGGLFLEVSWDGVANPAVTAEREYPGQDLPHVRIHYGCPELFLLPGDVRLNASVTADSPYTPHDILVIAAEDPGSNTVTGQFEAADGERFDVTAGTLSMIIGPFPSLPYRMSELEEPIAVGTFSVIVANSAGESHEIQGRFAVEVVPVINMC